MKIRNQLKKVLIILAGIAILSTNLIAKETVTYPKESKSIQILGFEKLENSFGISSSSEGNTVYINSGGKPLERVFGAAEDSNNKFSEIKNNHVIINGGILATNGYWEKNGVKTVRGGSVYGGYSHRGSAINNKIVIEGNLVTFGEESVLFGGRGSRNINIKDNKPTPVGVITGNTLDLKAKNVKVKDIKNFEKIVFEISNTAKQNDKILKRLYGDDELNYKYRDIIELLEYLSPKSLEILKGSLEQNKQNVEKLNLILKQIAK